MKEKTLIFFIAFCIFQMDTQASEQQLQVVHSWNLLDYEFPSQRERQEATIAGNLIPSNGIPIDVAVVNAGEECSRERIFVTVPRFQGGIPFTLATINSCPTKDGNGPPLRAYPDYNSHRSNGCNEIISAFRVAITECQQMWVIDSGRIGSNQQCPPKLMLFDLQSDKLIHRFVFNSSLYTPSASLFITPIVDVRNRDQGCRQTMIYLADVDRHGLVVYNYETNQAWRVEDKWMHPDPDYGTHTIAGESFTLMDGMFAMSTDKQNLYFHPLASVNEFAVPLSVLNDPNNFASGFEAQASHFQKLGSRRSQCASEAIDSRGNLYCVTFNPIKLISWNVRAREYSPKAMREVPADGRLLEFVSGIKVVRNKSGKEELWMMSNRFQKISAGTQNPNEINFRIVKRSIDDIQNDLHSNLIFT